MDRRIAESWDSEYEAGRYEDEPPVPFVQDVVAACEDAGLIGSHGLYIGCGNGRNYLPLVAAGLDLIGLDISGMALEQLARRAPELRHRLVEGDVAELPKESAYAIVIGIQVFQHGDRATAHSHLRLAQERLTPDGLFCLRVNALGTDIEYDYELIEEDDDGGFTIRYLDGPKTGLLIHFFSEVELSALFSRWEEVLRLRLQRTWREPRDRGSWLQWEAIWRR